MSDLIKCLLICDSGSKVSLASFPSAMVPRIDLHRLLPLPACVARAGSINHQAVSLPLLLLQALSSQSVCDIVVV